MNSFEAKQEARRVRMIRAAETLEKAAAVSRARGLALGAAIPFGQPVLVGHHSEKRHRRDLERLRTWASKEVQLSEKAQELRRKADAVGSAGVSSDDPEGVAKLRAQLAAHAEAIAEMKRVNADFRKRGELALSPATREAWRKLKAVCPWETQPFPAYALTNANANRRRIEQRIKDLEAMAARAAAVADGQAQAWTESGPAGRAVEDLDENRVILSFASRLSQDDYKLVRSRGFVWSKTREAFVRKAGANARWAAGQLLQVITGGGKG